MCVLLTTGDHELGYFSPQHPQPVSVSLCTWSISSSIQSVLSRKKRGGGLKLTSRVQVPAPLHTILMGSSSYTGSCSLSSTCMDNISVDGHNPAHSWGCGIEVEQSFLFSTTWLQRGLQEHVSAVVCSTLAYSFPCMGLPAAISI